MVFLHASSAGHGTELAAEIVVVGSGAAGIPVAVELTRAGIDVLLIETGELTKDRAFDDLSRGEAVDPRHGHLDRYRARVFGGTTKLWGGRCAPFDPIDFEARTYVDGSGWPIRREDLDPHYRAAHDYLHLGAFDYAAESALPGAARLPLPSFCDQSIWRYSEPADFGRDWRAFFASATNARVLLGATCVTLETADDGRVTRAMLRTLNGAALTARAGTFVVAAGGLETPRLLLNSSSETHPRGIGNQHDNVGRYYISHLAGTVGPHTWTSSPATAMGLRYQRTPDGIYARRSLSLRPEVQREAALLNSRFIVSSPAMSNPSHGSAVLSAGFLAKRFLLNKVPPEFDSNFGRDGVIASRRAHIDNVRRGVPELAKFAPWWFARRIVPKRKIPSMEPSVEREFHLHFDAEQTPLRKSRVALGADTDALGVRRLRVDWHVLPSDVLSLTDSYLLLVRELADARIAPPPAGLDRDALAELISAKLGVGSHHIGTTRMTTDPRDGVVDANARVFGTDNLYIAAPSVFPTAGVANPVLTTVAMAVRLARHLVEVRKSAAPVS